MLRRYIRKAPQRKLVSEEQLTKAKKLIKVGKSQRYAAESVGISESALRKRLKFNDVAISLGRFKQTFTKNQEAQFLVYCVKMNEMFYGIRINDIRRLAYEFATMNEIKHRFNDSTKMAGRKWVQKFLQRNPGHKLLQSPHLSSAIGVNKIEVDKFYDNLKQVYEHYKFRPSRIYNMDETELSIVSKNLPKAVTSEDKNVVEKNVSDDPHTTVTVIICMNVTGQFASPAFIYRGKRPEVELSDNSPLQSVCMVSDNGFVNTKLFIEWLHSFKDFVHPSKEDPVLLILDNHYSHISLEATNYAHEHHIVILVLPPNGSRKLQPLDVAINIPLKTQFYMACEKWMDEHPGREITQLDVARLFSNTFEQVATTSNVESGFKTTGIYPFANNLFDESDFAPSTNPNISMEQPPTSNKKMAQGNLSPLHVYVQNSDKHMVNQMINESVTDC